MFGLKSRKGVEAQTVGLVAAIVLILIIVLALALVFLQGSGKSKSIALSSLNVRACELQCTNQGFSGSCTIQTDGTTATCDCTQKGTSGACSGYDPTVAQQSSQQYGGRVVPTTTTSTSTVQAGQTYSKTITTTTGQNAVLQAESVTISSITFKNLRCSPGFGPKDVTIPPSIDIDCDKDGKTDITLGEKSVATDKKSAVLEETITSERTTVAAGETLIVQDDWSEGASTSPASSLTAWKKYESATARAKGIVSLDFDVKEQDPKQAGVTCAVGAIETGYVVIDPAGSPTTFLPGFLSIEYSDYSILETEITVDKRLVATTPKICNPVADFNIDGLGLLGNVWDMWDSSTAPVTLKLPLIYFRQGSPLTAVTGTFSKSYQAYEITQNWGPGTNAWTHLRSGTGGWSQINNVKRGPIGTASFTRYPSDYSVDVTDIVKGHFTGRGKNYGFMIADSEGTGAVTLNKADFSSKDMRLVVPKEFKTSGQLVSSVFDLGALENWDLTITWNRAFGSDAGSIRVFAEVCSTSEKCTGTGKEFKKNTRQNAGAGRYLKYRVALDRTTTDAETTRSGGFLTPVLDKIEIRASKVASSTTQAATTTTSAATAAAPTGLQKNTNKECIDAGYTVPKLNLQSVDQCKTSCAGKDYCYRGPFVGAFQQTYDCFCKP